MQIKQDAQLTLAILKSALQIRSYFNTEGGKPFLCPLFYIFCPSLDKAAKTTNQCLSVVV